MARRKYKTKCRQCKKYSMITYGFSYCFDCWQKYFKKDDAEEKEE